VLFISSLVSTLVFSPLILEDKSWIDRALDNGNRRSLEYNFTANYIWRKVYKLSAARFEDKLIVMSDPENPSFIFPSGEGPVGSIVRALADYVRERGKPLVFNTLLNEEREKLETAFPGKFKITPNRKDFDYVYETEKMISLGGKKLSAKRNHINRFMAMNPDWYYESITGENIADAHKMNLEWCLSAGCREDENLYNESCAVEQAFEHFFDLGLKGGLLRSQGRPIAFTMGEPLSKNTYIVHVEKAFHEIQGSYQVINQQFAMANCRDYLYINREDDAGDEGLRKAKLSYYPVTLVEKSSAELLSPL
jgi:hypothetical protein